MPFVQLDLDLAVRPVPGTGPFLEINGRQVEVCVRRNPRAKNYVLCVRRDGTLAVTVPRRGSFRGAMEFVARRQSWIERTLARLAARPCAPQHWQAGTEVLHRGRRIPIHCEANGGLHEVFLESERCGRVGASENLRPVVEGFLRRAAVRELPSRVIELAALHQCAVTRVTIRNQRSRWGSCSRRGTISLNWRLIQVPEAVRDYIILHELMHLREMNHSRRFWAQVEAVCPNYLEHERWLKQHGPILGM